MSFFDGKLDAKGRYKATALLDSELVKMIEEIFISETIEIKSLVELALWHYLSCPLAEVNGKATAIKRRQTDMVIEARMTKIEKELGIRQVI